MPATATKTKLRAVELPTCPVEGCRRVGKILGTFTRGRFYCTGSTEVPHRRTKMVLRSFREVAS